MPTYIYETIPQTDGEQPQQFEIKQCMSDPALRTHPETGQPVRRVITGGLGYLSKGKEGAGHGHAHEGGCGCCCHAN